MLGFDSRGGGRRPFGSGFRRDYDDRRDDYRGSGERYDRYGDRDDKYERRDERREDRGETLQLSLCRINSSYTPRKITEGLPE